MTNNKSGLKTFTAKIFLSVIFQMMWVTGFAQSLSLSHLGESFSRTNLDVRWEPTNMWPSTVWVYQVLPKTWPTDGLSNLVAECGFTEKNLVQSNASTMRYAVAGKWDIRHPDKSLDVSGGNILYFGSHHIDAANLPKNVPPMNHMLEVTTNFLTKIGFDVSEINKNPDGTPKIDLVELPTLYHYRDGTTVTNIDHREARFKRSIDGADILGFGGDGRIQFGEHGKPVQIDISWQNFKRYQSRATVTPNVVIQRIREGKSVQGGIPMNLPPIDWASVKSLTIHKADICYYAGDDLAPSAWLMPLVSLWTTVDTGNGNVEVEIDCPVIDDTKL